MVDKYNLIIVKCKCDTTAGCLQKGSGYAIINRKEV